MIRTSESIANIAKALSAAQGAMKGAAKDSTNPFFNSKYADLAAHWEAFRPHLAPNGLALVQAPSTEFIGEPEVYTWKSRSGEERSGVRMATKVTVTTRLVHESGEWFETDSAAMLPVGDPQAVGSATTYLRRYGASAVMGTAPEDDDGEATARPVPQAQRREPSPSPTPAHGERLLTEPQRKKLWADAKAKDMSEEQFKEMLFANTGKLSTKDVPFGAMDTLLGAIQAWAPPVPAPADFSKPPAALEESPAEKAELDRTIGVVGTIAPPLVTKQAGEIRRMIREKAHAKGLSEKALEELVAQHAHGQLLTTLTDLECFTAIWNALA